MSETTERAEAILSNAPELGNEGAKGISKQAMLDMLKCNVCDRATERGVRAGLYVETDPIIWSAETDDGNAVVVLTELGWDEDRMRQELTLAISEEGRDFVRALLEDLIARAREEWEQQNSKSFEEGVLTCQR